MSEDKGTRIHNGEIIGGNPLVGTEELPARQSKLPEELDPDQLAAVMARTVSDWLMDSGQVKTPMDLVNRLLQLKDEAGRKLVFTRFDLFQCFAIWSKKLTGQDRVG